MALCSTLNKTKTMNQEIAKIKLSEIFNGYSETANSVVGMGGLLNIQPAFQREFIYPLDKQEACIHTILKDCTLGLLTWFENDNKGSYELGDGKQRLTSACNYVSGKYPITLDGKPMFFFNLPAETQKKIMDYEFLVVIVSGTAQEKLDWFKIINTAGAVLTTQELRNASYTGPWLESAKQYFSKPNCPAYNLGSKYLSGTLNRQDYLETALEWASSGDPEGYMAKHQKDSDATELWDHFDKVLKWFKSIFPDYKKEMNGLPLGRLYDEYHGNTYDPVVLKGGIDRLYMDDDVTKKSGIFEYLLSSKIKERVLSIRSFTDSQKASAYARQGGICPRCGKHFEITEMQGDHIIPWSKGGKTIPDNLQMLCTDCNRTKTNS